MYLIGFLAGVLKNKLSYCRTDCFPAVRCACGAAKQSFAHVLKECPVAKGVLEAGMGHVDGDTPFEKFVDVLTMRWEGLGPGSDQKTSQIITNIAALEDVL